MKEIINHILQLQKSQEFLYYLNTLPDEQIAFINHCYYAGQMDPDSLFERSKGVLEGNLDSDDKSLVERRDAGIFIKDFDLVKTYLKNIYHLL